MVRPPSRHHAFSGPWTPKGTLPAATASRKRCTHGSPGGSSSRRGHVSTRAPRPSRIARVAASAVTGTKTRIGQSTARASVLAAIAALPQEAMARGGRDAGSRHGARPARSSTSRWRRIVKRCRAFCEPATWRVSSLIHTPPGSTKPSRAESASWRANGVARKPVPATRATRASTSRTNASREASSMPSEAASASHASRWRKARNGLASPRPSAGAGPARTGRSGATGWRSASTWWRSAPVARGQRHESGVSTGTSAPHVAQTQRAVRGGAASDTSGGRALRTRRRPCG